MVAYKDFFFMERRRFELKEVDLILAFWCISLLSLVAGKGKMTCQ